MPSCVLSIHSAAFFQTAFGRAVIGARRDRVIGVGGWKGRSRSRRMPSGSGRELMDERGTGSIRIVGADPLSCRRTVGTRDEDDTRLADECRVGRGRGAERRGRCADGCEGREVQYS